MVIAWLILCFGYGSGAGQKMHFGISYRGYVRQFDQKRFRKGYTAREMIHRYLSEMSLFYTDRRGMSPNAGPEFLPDMHQ